MNRGKAVPYRGLLPFDLSLWEGSEKAHSGGAQYAGSSFSSLYFSSTRMGFGVFSLWLVLSGHVLHSFHRIYIGLSLIGSLYKLFCKVFVMNRLVKICARKYHKKREEVSHPRGLSA